MKFHPRVVDAPVVPLLLPDARRPHPTDAVRCEVGVQARSLFAAYTDLGRRYRLTGFSKSPWELLNGQFRNLMPKAFFFPLSGNATITYKDDSGTNRTLHANQSGATTFSALTGGFNGPALKYGVGGAAPAATDFNIQTQEGNTLYAGLTGVTYDQTNKTVGVSSSEVYGGAGATIAEVACFGQWIDNIPAVRTCLTDRSLLSPSVALATAQTAAVSYLWQF